jgi:Glycosyl transferase family 2
MRIIVHIGLPHCGSERIQQVLDDKREQLQSAGVLFARAPGRKNHTRLYMAVSDPDHIDPLRWNRGYGSAKTQGDLADALRGELAAEIALAHPQSLILSAEQLGTSLHRVSELERLRAFLTPFSDDIRVVAHVDEQSRVLARHYAEQVLEGRTASLTRDLALLDGDWFADARAEWDDISPMTNGFPEIQAAPFWLDYRALVTHWDAVFGAGSVSLRSYDATRFAQPDVSDELRAAFDLPDSIGKAPKARIKKPPSAAWTTRNRAMNQLFAQALLAGRIISRQMWRRLLGDIKVAGPAIDPGSLWQISEHFTADNATLLGQHPALTAACLTPPPKTADWVEADPERGYRAAQYFTVFLPMIDKATGEERTRKQDVIAALVGRQSAAAPPNGAALVQPTGDLPPLARANFSKLQGGRFAPHNDVGRVNEEELAAPYPVVAKRKLPKGSSGNVIVACMKNEGPYIVEWVAYHRAIGVDNFLIYTNNCDDGTAEILDRLQEMGIVQHRNNDAWKGNSPQQYALNQSLKEPLIQQSDWIIHIDVDEFINVRCGNGTLADFLSRVPEATNIAMTWRLFGHNGVTKFQDRPVIEQFDSCAPKYCPKPHTVWGFKTMMRNIGAYEKISCHRPNKLRESHRDQVRWVNGSGQDMGDDIKKKGWRSEMKSIGYDLIQLNHYALRSAESFLIKRQRGRALHVDRTIGINYWVRMDWSHNRDITILRNRDRLGVEMAALMDDVTLATLHQSAVDWHHAKAAELHEMPEFKDLYANALATKLTELERVAYALALDMES